MKLSTLSIALFGAFFGALLGASGGMDYAKNIYLEQGYINGYMGGLTDMHSPIKWHHITVPIHRLSMAEEYPLIPTVGQYFEQLDMGGEQ